ncbi:MAG: hypothetical protein KGL53_08405, partial [Elusimicrobia bacterium]|nr:hypothetical protein [Elusimicrobiota bacterium]
MALGSLHLLQDGLQRAREGVVAARAAEEARLRELAFLNKGVRIVLTDRREKEEDGTAYSKVFYSEGGIIEFVEMMDQNAGRNALIPKILYVEGLDPVTNVAVEVALNYNDA